MKQRNLSFDYIRILACMLVVLMHSPLPSPNASGVFLTTLSYITAPCIGLFFMVSGALLLPIREAQADFLKRRFSKIALPTLVWSLLYILLNTYNSESEINLLQSLISIPFSAQGNGVLWFMYTLAGLYLLSPILSAWLKSASRRDIEFILLLWGLTLCYPLIGSYAQINTSNIGILYYFTGYAGYFLLGAYLKQYPVGKRVILLFSLIALSGIALLGILKAKHIEFDFYSLFWYLSIFIASLAIAVWGIIQMVYAWSNKTPERAESPKRVHESVIIQVSNLSFGIYLAHILIMRSWLWKQDWIIDIAPYPLQCLTIFILTFLLSLALCKGISLLPFADMIIGYKSSRK